jgi:tol-pal system protein YbgF
MPYRARLFTNQGHWWLIAGAFAVCLVPVMVHAQSAVDDRLSRIERDIDTLSRSVFKGQRPPTGALASGNRAIQDQLEARLNQLEQDLRDLTAKVEEQGFGARQTQQAMTDLIGRLSALEQRQGAGAAPTTSATPAAVTAPMVTNWPERANPNEPAPAAAPSVEPLGTLSTNLTNDPTAAPAANDPTFMYENALELLKQRDYGLAEKSLNDFLRTFPNHNLAPNARYWLGETYFVQDRFDQAARVFAEGYQKFPKGPKAADNLLKLGLSLAAQRKTDDACVALKQIAKDFPNGSAVVKSRAESEIKKLACG